MSNPEEYKSLLDICLPFPTINTKPFTSTHIHNKTDTHTHTHTHTHTRLTALFSGLPGWAVTRKVTPIWIFVKQETVSGSGISWAVCKSAPRSSQITTPAPHYSVFYRPDALPVAKPTASKHWRHKQNWQHYKIWTLQNYMKYTTQTHTEANSNCDTDEPKKCKKTKNTAHHNFQTNTCHFCWVAGNTV